MVDVSILSSGLQVATFAVDRGSGGNSNYILCQSLQSRAHSNKYHPLPLLYLGGGTGQESESNSVRSGSLWSIFTTIW